MPRAMKRKSHPIEGFVRLQIMDYDKEGNPSIIAGDSGWSGPNQMTDIGFINYINYLLGNSAGSLQVHYAAVGSGSTPAAAATVLPNEYGTGDYRRTVTYSAPSSTKIRFVASWASTDQTTGANYTVNNAGLYHTNNVNSIMCGKTFATSTWGTNQALNLTYELNLSFT